MVVSQQESGSTPVMIGSQSDAQIIWKQEEAQGYRRDPLKKRQGGLAYRPGYYYDHRP